jgi:DNA-binding transcriptional ArsR family regulator
MSQSSVTPLSRNEVLSALSDDRRRTVLGTLADRVTPVSELCLAVHVAAGEIDGSIADPTIEEVNRVHRDLQHRHLPKLDAAGLARWNREGGTVTRTDHPLYSLPEFETVVRRETDGWSEILANLADDCRREVLRVLEATPGSLSLEALTEDVLEWADSECARREKQVDDDAAVRTNVRTRLYHVHLPKLAADGLIEWDPEAKTARYVGHPALDEDLLTWSVRVPSETTVQTSSAVTQPPDETRID